MNQLFIVIGGIIVASLVALLAAPLYIDWSQHRGFIEHKVSSLLGYKVSVKGSVDVKILPTPTITLTNIELGKQNNAPLMSAEELTMRVELLALATRRINITEMAFLSPQMSARLHADGTTSWDDLQVASPPNVDLKDKFEVSLHRATVENGSIYLADELTGRTLRLEAINASFSAQSIQGPWKAKGSARRGDDVFDFNIASGELSGKKLRLKAILSPQKVPVEGVFNGEIVFAKDDQRAGGPVYTGDVTFRPNRQKQKERDSSIEQASFLAGLSGQFQLDRSTFILRKAQIGDRGTKLPFDLSGSIQIAFDKAMRFEAVLSSRQINFDAIYGEYPGDIVSVNGLKHRITELLHAMPKPSIPGDVSVNVPGIVVGGDVVRSVRFDAHSEETGWRINKFSAILPGTTQVGFDGFLETANGLLVDGNLSVSSERPTALAHWWHSYKDPQSRRIKVRNVRFDGKISAEKNALRVFDMRAAMGASDLSGRFSYNKISDRQRNFDAKLDAERIDLDALQVLVALFVGKDNLSGFEPQDIVRLNVRADRLLTQAAEGRNAVADLTLSSGEIKINSLEIADFAGATLDISGELKNFSINPAGRLSGTVSAQQAEGLIKLGRFFLPQDHALLNHLVRNGHAFMPLDVALNFSGDQKQSSNESDFAATLTGRMGGGDVRMGLRFVGDWEKPGLGDFQFSLSSAYTSGAALLRQVGVPILIDVQDQNPANVEISAKGKAQDRMKLSASLLLETVHSEANGLVYLPESGSPRFETELALNSDNVEPLLQMLGFSLPASGLGMAASLRANWSGDGINGRFDNLEGVIAKKDVSGTLIYHGQPIASTKPWRWTGALAIDRATLHWLAALGTGEVIDPLDFDISPESVGEAYRAVDDFAEDVQKSVFQWSAAPFDKPYLRDVHLDLDIKAHYFDITDAITLEAPSFSLQLRENTLVLNELTANFADGRVSGSLQFENNDGLVGFSSLINIDHLRAGDILWSDGRRPFIEGRVTGSVTLNSDGRSLDAMIGSMEGDGSVRLEKTRIRRINPAAFGLILEAADNDDLALNEATIRPLIESYLDAGAVELDSAEISFTVRAGIARIGNIVFDHEHLGLKGSAIFNLSESSMNGALTVFIDPVQLDQAAVSGSTLEIGVLFEGDITQPRRNLDLQPLLSYLTVRRFEQEVKRVEILQADILERQRLSRYMRWVAAEQRREKRLLEEKRLNREKEAQNLRFEQLKRRRNDEEESGDARFLPERALKLPFAPVPLDRQADLSNEAISLLLEGARTSVR